MNLSVKPRKNWPKPELILHMHLVKCEWEGQKERCVGVGRKKEWKKYDT